MSLLISKECGHEIEMEFFTMFATPKYKIKCNLPEGHEGNHKKRMLDERGCGMTISWKNEEH